MDSKGLFNSLTDTVIVTDLYGYILDFNRSDCLDGLKKGKKITRWIGNFSEEQPSEIRIGDRIYQKKSTPVVSDRSILGYTIFLSDITEEIHVKEQRIIAENNLKELIEKQYAANEALTNYAMEVKKLTDYSEQIRIARSIHDDSGHAITAVHAISQMCLKLRGNDDEAYRERLLEGIEICENAGYGVKKEYTSLSDMLQVFCKLGQFPTSLSISGEEPAFAKKLYPLIEKICKEAYHNTLSHSLGENFFIDVDMDEKHISLQVYDDGLFHGVFEKGFGLTAMEENVIASGGSITFVAEQNEYFKIKVSWEGKHE